MPQTNQLFERLNNRLFGSRLITNVVRGIVVEEIVAIALEPDWAHCGSDYASCDMIHPASGTRMQIKQAAALQSWGPLKGPPRFSIAHKKGAWVDNGQSWIPGRSRNAEIFVFGWHPLTTDEADHRDPSQWHFYPVRESSLPDQESIALSALDKITNPCRYNDMPTIIGDLL